MLHFLLREMNDPDFEFMRQLEVGTTAGVLEPLPRTPALYEEQTSWRLKDDPFQAPELAAANYVSLENHIYAIELQFREEEKLQMMREYSLQDFNTTFGKNQAIAALAVLEEKASDGSLKLRCLHDGTHVVRVNHRIRCRDRQRMPGIPEKHCQFREYRAAGKIPMAFLGDVTKAHRLCKIAPQEWGMLACQLRAESVWVNCVGTFGIGSASYFWGRTIGAIVRCLYGLLGKDFPIELLVFADDLNFDADGALERKSVVFSFFLLTVLGVPFKWTKCRGGFEVDWIGLHLVYRSYSLGLSTSRAGWLISWIITVLAVGKVGTREAAGALGRLSFAAQALFHEKALLGPLYLWVSAVLRGASEVVVLPCAIRLILGWYRVRLEGAGRVQATPSIPIDRGELFRSDAKAEGGRATIGGWECAGGVAPAQARWYFVEVTRDWAPWAFAKANDPQRVIATLELLGTLLCIVLFGDKWDKPWKGQGILTGSTDNAGNTFATAKLMSTMWPLTALLIELSEQLRARECGLHLLWRQRDINTEADAITNEDFSSFSPALRVNVVPSEIKWLVLPEVLASSQKLYEEVVSERAVQKQNSTAKFRWKKTGPAKRLKFSDPW